MHHESQEIQLTQFSIPEVHKKENRYSKRKEETSSPRNKKRAERAVRKSGKKGKLAKSCLGLLGRARGFPGGISSSRLLLSSSAFVPLLDSVSCCAMRKCQEWGVPEADEKVHLGFVVVLQITDGRGSNGRRPSYYSMEGKIFENFYAQSSFLE